MDCKLEHASRSLVRIEVILLQGLFHALVSSVALIMAIPIVPFCLTYVRMSNEKGKGTIEKMIIIPWWFIQSILIAVTAPILNMVDSYVSMKEVARMEWTNRWRASHPKKPNGHPLIRQEGEREFLDRAVEISVLNDYGEKV